MEDVKNTKVVSFIGTEKCDIAYFIARLTSLTGKEVMVVDNSGRQDLYNAIPRPDAEDEFGYQGRVTFASRLRLEDSFKEAFDVVIYYNGWTFDEEIIRQSDIVFAVMNYTLGDRSRIQEMSEKVKPFITSDTKFCSVFRDKPAMKIKEKDIETFIGYPPLYARYVIPFDMKDYTAYVVLTHTGRQSASKANISQAYLSMMEDMLYEIADVDANRMKKLAKKMKDMPKGGYYA